MKIQLYYNDMVMGKRQLLVKVAHLNWIRVELVFHLEPGTRIRNDVMYSRAKLILRRIQPQ
jgi:hypothetical protein